MTQSKTTNDCPGCKREAEPGWIETDNNGPIVPCWLCNRERWLDDRGITRGMQYGIDAANAVGIPVEMRRLQDVE